MEVARMDPLVHFQRRLAETMAWCAAHDWTANPGKELRTALLHPPDPTESAELFWDSEATHRQRQQLVERLATRRAKLLEEQGITPLQLVPPLTGGRLLAFNADQTLSDGAANSASRGFFDDDNVPPWDTWIAYMTDDMVDSRPRYPFSSSSLLSWVPERLIEKATAGIEVNPEACICWATELDTAFLLQLRKIGLVH